MRKDDPEVECLAAALQAGLRHRAQQKLATHANVEPAERLRDQPCSALGCDRTALCQSALGPLCGLHYQRFVRINKLDLARRELLAAPSCRICGQAIPTDGSHKSQRVRARKRGYAYCSIRCSTKSKKAKAQEETAMRFMRRVQMRADDECWPYQGAVSTGGYGNFGWHAPWDKRSRNHAASRMMWLILHGRPPKGKEVCHSCDNPICCNPGHLWLGTHQENMADMVSKGRASNVALRGEAHPLSKLTAADVHIIRTSPETSKVVGKQFGIAPNHVQKIRRKECWKHV